MAENNDFITGMLAGQSDNDGFGGGGWLGAVIILAIIFGWGNGGYGFGGGGGQNVRDMYTLNSDFATLQRQLSDGFASQERRTDSIINGLSNVGYTQQTLANNTNTALLQGFNAQQAQLADCCCKTQSGIQGINTNIASALADVKYTMATDTCALKTQMNTNTRDIIDSQNAGFRAILDDLCKLRIEQKDDKIAAQAQRISALELAASQAAQNNYIIDRLSPKPPVAAFNVPAPWQYGGCGCNQNTCC